MSKSIYCVGKKIGEDMVTEQCKKDNANTHAKRINIVSIKMVKEDSMLYHIRKISSPSDAATLGKHFLQFADREEVVACCLNTKNQPISMSVISMDSLNSSLVHPREVFKVAILSNAASIIIFHNHASGDVNPSSEDIKITNRIKEAGKIMGIELLDHIIIGTDNNYCSLKDKDIL